MSKQLVFTFLAAMPLLSHAQEEILDATDRAKIAANRPAADTTGGWKKGGTIGLNMSQSYFSNWAAGGQNAVAGTALTSLFARYNRNRNSWETTLDLAYGLLSQDGKKAIKTDDRIDLTSKYGYQLDNPNWYYSALFNFRTQFTDGFVIENGANVGDPISGFMAPAFSILSLGIDYKPNDKFSAMISPTTSKITVVTEDRLATSFGVDEGENVRFEVGAFVKLAYRDDIATNVNLLTRIDLFSNYLNNPQNIDINWETLLTTKINKWLSTTLTTQLVYDDDIKFSFTNDEGVVTTGPRTQFRQIFALGLSFKL